MLFLNVEPAALATPAPAGAELVVAAARRDLRVMLELTERALTMHPAELLQLVGWARQCGWSIALDDVGAAPESLALLPFLAPDVIKLDVSLVTRRPTAEQASVMAAVLAHNERTGAVILAEGIETPGHVDQALALGATLGQGWLFGRPGQLVVPPAPSVPIPLTQRQGPVAGTPFQLLAGRPTRVGRKGLLLDLSRHIETKGLQLDIRRRSYSVRSRPPSGSHRQRRLGTRRWRPAAHSSRRSQSASTGCPRQACTAASSPPRTRSAASGRSPSSARTTPQR
jgi:hypothetical protein